MVALKRAKKFSEMNMVGVVNRQRGKGKQVKIHRPVLGNL